MARLRGRASPGPPQHDLLLQREEGPIATPPLTVFAGWRGGGSAVESQKGRRRHGCEYFRWSCIFVEKELSNFTTCIIFIKNKYILMIGN